MQGYGANGATLATGEGAANGGIAEQVTQAALNYRANAPVVDAMLRELGLVDKDKGGLNDLLTGNNALTTQAMQVVEQANVKLNGYSLGEQKAD